MQDCYAGADPRYRLPVRIITEQAWHSLFARHMFIDVPDATGAPAHDAGVHGHRLPGLPRRPGGARHELRSLHPPELRQEARADRRHELRRRDQEVDLHRDELPAAAAERAVDALLGERRHRRATSRCSSACRAPARRRCRAIRSGSLIGDDEHGWSEDGVFNFEGGCYAKMIRLSAEAEPQIYATTRRFGTVLENVVMDAGTRRLDLDDDSLTENTRGAYPLEFIDNAVPSGQAGHPRNIVMLTADAFGVLPPIARLSPAGRDVSLPVRLHGEGGGHREGRDRAEGDVQHLLRRAVHGAAPDRVREVPRRADRAARRARVARQHRLDGRPVRRRLADEDRAHARDDPRGAVGRARQRAVRDATRSSTSTCRRRCPGVPPKC